MENKTRIECPKCGRPLQKYNGHIGYCALHKWVSPVGAGYDAEAAEQNRQDAAALEKLRLEQERQRAEAEEQKRIGQHQSMIRKIIAVVIALALVAAAVVYYIVRPSLNYSQATKHFSSGEYEAARKQFTALGSYKEAAARAFLCEAMLDLQEGRTEDAAAKLEQMIGEGQGETARQLADALLPMMADWKAQSLSAQAELLLLSKAEIIDPNGTLNQAKLSEEAHTALLDGMQLASYAEDVDGDSGAELVVLNADYTVSVYRMTADSNLRMSVDNQTASACAMRFGNSFQDTDLDAAVACFSEAYRLLPQEGSRSALTAAYQRRSNANENAGDMAAAIADARTAMEISGTAESFSFYYEVNLRNAKNGHDAATALAIWDEFAADSVSELTRFSAKDRWQADAAQLYLARAAELAAKKDEVCIETIRTAANMGADVFDAIAEAESHFEPGLSLARLRLLEMELVGNDAAKAQQVQAAMAEEVRTAISEWKDRGISPADVPTLIFFADTHGIDLTGIDRDACYEEAAVAAAGNTTQYSFVNWDGNDYQELLALDASGRLSLYGIEESWGLVSALETNLPDSSYSIADESAPLILVLSSEKDELLAVTGTSTKLSPVFREAGIQRYKADGSAVSFSRKLEGSIARYSDYAYTAVGTENRPVRTGIDWQQNDYPQPESAAAAVQRYFEARAYDIPEEAALLTAEPTRADIFSLDALSALTAPDIPGTVSASAYLTQEGRELFEVSYSSGPQQIRTWIAVEYSDGWKLVGAADTFSAGQTDEKSGYSVPLLSLNSEVSHRITAKDSRETYRLLIPASGRLALLWQSGRKTESRTAYTVTMQRGSLTGDSVFNYELQPSLNKQQSKDMFVSAGVYYLTVEAKISGADEYRMMLSFEPETHVELENNDTPAKATPVDLNITYSGTLSSTKDVDVFYFSLDADNAVNVTLGLPGSGSKTTTHSYAVYSAADGSNLSSVSMAGNAQLSETGNLNLSAGSYLVQVSKGSSFSTDEYLLTVNAAQNGSMESEPNNTPETADTVSVNEEIHASIGKEGDVDCFTFTLDSPAVIQPRFSFTPTDSASKTYVLTVWDNSRHELLKVNIGGKESSKLIVPVALTAGTYTVKLENPRFVRQDYTLQLVCMSVGAAEQEPNNSAGLATALGIGQPFTGVLSSDADVDYYKLSFAEQTTVTLRFSFAQSTGTSTTFVLSIEQNGKAQWTSNIKGDSGGTEQTLQFAAGEYYIRVKPSTWLGAVYTIEMN